MTNENNYAHVKLPKKVYDRIEQKVTSMYVELGITSVPIDPFDIAARRGYIVRSFSSLGSSSKLISQSPELDGVSCFDPELQTFVICYDDSYIAERIRFTLMHEIGHIDLGHLQESELAKKEADYYAAYALAPSPIISLMRCEDYMDLARAFKVSQTCADFCFQRYVKWVRITKRPKPYEKALLDLFQKQL